MSEVAGWKIKKGTLESLHFNDDDYWEAFNHFYRNGKKRNTYKFGIVKSILDNLFNFECKESGYFLSFQNLFSKFTENYWNLIVRYNLRQMRKDGKSEFSKIEGLLMNRKFESFISYELVNDDDKDDIVKTVEKECKTYVLGALYKDLNGCIFGFDLSNGTFYISKKSFSFLFRYKHELETINYFYWAKFLETVNDEKSTENLLSKLELSTPKRSDLSMYKKILTDDFKENKCFYCGKKLRSNIHVDHFIPWSFIKEDKIWNFVLSCSKCNIKKSDSLPQEKNIHRIIIRNEQLRNIQNDIVINDFRLYDSEIIQKMWNCAKMSGYKEIINK